MEPCSSENNDQFENTQDKIKILGSMVAKLNENSKCRAPGCRKKPIMSHTFPKAYLTQLAGGKTNKLYYLEEKQLLNGTGEPFDSSGFKIGEPAQISKTKLFCAEHDTKLFRRIENPVKDNEPTNNEHPKLETHLFLSAYRHFLQGITLNNSFAEADNTENYSDELKKMLESFKELRPAVEKACSLAAEATRKMNSSELNKVEKCFSEIFHNDPEPKANDFKKHFDIRYYEMHNNPGLLCSGLSFQRAAKDAADYAPVLTFLGPGPDPNVTYICFVTLKKETPHRLLQMLPHCSPNAAFGEDTARQAFNWLLFLFLDSPYQLIMRPALFESFTTPIGELIPRLHWWPEKALRDTLERARVNPFELRNLPDVFSFCYRSLNPLKRRRLQPTGPYDSIAWNFLESLHLYDLLKVCPESQNYQQE